MSEVSKVYDVIIVGGGPAGYTAALYCTRAELSTLVLEQLSAGGQMATTEIVDNYPGFEDGINGFDLAMKMQAGAHRFGAKTELAEVTKLHLNAKIKKVETSEGVFEAKSIIIATGASPRKLDLEEEDSYRGRGVAYCATCDGALYRGKTVSVVGGGNSAVADALFLSKICTKVYLIHRRDALRASNVYLKSLKETKNIEFVWDSKITKIFGEGPVKGVTVTNVKTNETKDIALDGIFVTIGRIPNTEIVKDSITIDKQGYIVADESGETNIPGVFAIGDVRTKALRQIVNACGDGATVSKYVEDYLIEQE